MTTNDNRSKAPGRIYAACFITGILAFGFLMAVNAAAQDRITGQAFASRSEVIASEAMVATSHPLATQAALDILRQGGSAVDAAIAANAVLGLMEPTGCGIGGDLFALIWDAEESRLYGLNASGRSPLSLSRDYFIENNYTRIPQRGALSVSVPGAVDGWFEMQARFGKMPIGQVLSPAIEYAEKGFPVTELIAYYLERSAPLLGAYPNFSETYMPAGRMPGKGEIFKNPYLAHTYRQLALYGRDEFYLGDIARVITEHVQQSGGFLTMEDMAAHRSEWVEPVSTQYRNYEVWQLPPNTQGIAVLQMLNILEHYDLSSMGLFSAEYIHLFTEAKKLAFEDRARYYADMDFSPVPLEQLISKEYASERRSLIDANRASRRTEPGMADSPNTIYLTTADSKGNMVSLIQSNYRGMGSGVTPPGLGFVLQNRGESFSLDSDHFNRYEPGKRPFHTIIPGFVTLNQQAFMSFGVMGGSMQPQGHVQILVNMIDFGMNLQEAGDAPRMQHTGSSEPTGEQMEDQGILLLESGFPWTVVRALIGKGHRVQWDLGGYGGYQAIMRDPSTGVYYGASESRKDGQAAGF